MAVMCVLCNTSLLGGCSSAEKRKHSHLMNNFSRVSNQTLPAENRICKIQTLIPSSELMALPLIFLDHKVSFYIMLYHISQQISLSCVPKTVTLR